MRELMGWRVRASPSHTTSHGNGVTVVASLSVPLSLQELSRLHRWFARKCASDTARMGLHRWDSEIPVRNGFAQAGVFEMWGVGLMNAISLDATRDVGQGDCS